MVDAAQSEQGAPWAHAFDVVDETGRRTDGHLPLEQVDKTCFDLCATIVYRREHETGLEKYLVAPTGLQRLRGNPLHDPGADLAAVIDEVRRVGPEEAKGTDLASVPGPLLWLVPRYGVHTPAALIHDKLIGPEHRLVKDWAADRYFRFMLRALGVRPFRRWLMWTAVALRTRFMTSPVHALLLVAWGVTSVAGISMLVVGLASSRTTLVVAALVLPFVASVAFGRQYGAGIVSAVGVPIAAPPAVLALVCLGVYWVGEGLAAVASLVRRRVARPRASAPLPATATPLLGEGLQGET